MIALKIALSALSLILAKVNAGENKFALDEASQFDRIAQITLVNHETDKQPAPALVDFVPEASTDAGVGTVGEVKSLRGFKTALTRAQTRNALTEIKPIDAGGTVLGRSIRRAGASARVSRLPE